MKNRPLVKIGDHCQRLSRRALEKEAGRPIAEEELDTAFDEACVTLWGVTYNDIDDELFPEIEEPDSLEQEKVWEEYALSRGYSLKSLRPGKLVPEAEFFFYMIKAEEFNAFARTPEDKARLALRREADDFLMGKEEGVIKGF